MPLITLDGLRNYENYELIVNFTNLLFLVAYNVFLQDISVLEAIKNEFRLRNFDEIGNARDWSSKDFDKLLRSLKSELSFPKHH